MAGGIVSAIFASGVIFVAIIFYFKYGQKLTNNDFVGAFFMVICIICISAGGALGGDNDDEKEKNSGYLVLGILFALLVGLAFAMNSLNIFWIISLGVNID